MSDELIPETPEDFTPEDVIQTSTYVERYHQRRRDEELAAGEITYDEYLDQQNSRRNFRKNRALQRAEDLGVADDPVALASIQSEVDQEYTEISAESERDLTEKALLVFKFLGPLAHPGMEWDQMSYEQQDVYREASEEVVIHQIENPPELF